MKKLQDSKDLIDNSVSDRMKSLINAGKLLNKNNYAVFHYVNQEIIYKSIVDLFSEMIPPDFQTTPTSLAVLVSVIHLDIVLE